MLCVVPVMLAAPLARADCELLYAPPQIRARLLAFHYANEQRRAGEHAKAVAAAALDRTARPAPPTRRLHEQKTSR